MKKYYSLIIVSLLPALFIYLFYRTERTVITELFIAVISYDSFLELRNSITTALPLQEHIIYSLPEGLWVFCITLTSKPLFLKISKHQVNLLYFPLVFSIGLECLQLLHITNGRFDLWDIGVSFLCWMIAYFAIPGMAGKQDILRPFNAGSSACIISYLVVYLAHVWK